jgi:hypothetical protein
VSHVIAGEYNFESLNVLDRACKFLGDVELVRDQTTHKWWDTWVNDYHADDAAYKSGVKPEDYGKCLHAIRVKGHPEAYEAGVIRNPNGKGYTIIYDFYGSKGRTLQDAIGEGGELLKQAYVAELNKREAINQGYRDVQIVRQGEELILTAEGSN